MRRLGFLILLAACGDDVKTEYVAGPAPTYASVSNLHADGLNLLVDGTTKIEVGSGQTYFQFPVGDAGAHTVTIAAQPTNQGCKVVGTNIDCDDRVSCKVLHADMPDLLTGSYRIDVDGESGLDPIFAYCDFSYAGGGWTLIESTANGAAPQTELAGTPAQATSRFLPFVVMQALANGSSQVHIRTPDKPDSESITSQPDNEVIANLRLGHVLNVGLDTLTNDEQAARWMGPYAQASRLGFACLTTGGAWPDVYWACGNQNGFHLVSLESTWEYGGVTTTGNAVGNTPLEVYVR